MPKAESETVSKSVHKGVAAATLENVNETGAARLARLEQVRVSPGGYLAALFFFSLVAGFLSYFELNAVSLALFCASWLTFPVLAWFDRIAFDGETLRRTGLLPRIWGRISKHPLELKVADIEQIETQAIRALQTGGRVFYRYRSEVCGANVNFAFASGGKSFRNMVRRLFPLVMEDKLDARSLELRDFLTDPKETGTHVEALHLPSAEVAESALKAVRKNDRMRRFKQNLWQRESLQTEAANQVSQLRQVANELRLSGNLAQSLEAFRRALFVAPKDGWLLLEFARALHSYANTSRQIKLMRRAVAALTLAAHASSDNAKLLARIGESYFQFGETKRAEKAFRQALAIDADNFRAYCGLAETALNDGKLAHVIHHYQAAARTAHDEAAKTWALAEADYFSLLNTDLDYMEAEFTRISWLHNTERGSRICLRLTILGLGVVMFGVFFDDAITELGLALAAGTAIFWLILSLAGKLLQTRSELAEDEEE
jgi:tetratricopeptide (TPR) repeat protein